MQDRIAAMQYNFDTFWENPLGEIAGSFGDFGTAAPLMIALASQGSISLTATLIFTGMANILVGAWFGLPIPVSSLPEGNVTL